MWITENGNRDYKKTVQNQSKQEKQKNFNVTFNVFNQPNHLLNKLLLALSFQILLWQTIISSSKVCVFIIDILRINNDELSLT